MLFSRITLSFRSQPCAVILAGADFLAAERIAKKWGEEAEVEHACRDHHQPNKRHDDAARAAHCHPANIHKNEADNSAQDAASGGSHEGNEGIHLISPLD